MRNIGGMECKNKYVSLVMMDAQVISPYYNIALFTHLFNIFTNYSSIIKLNCQFHCKPLSNMYRNTRVVQMNCASVSFRFEGF